MEAPLTIKITGPDLDRLLKISREVESFVYASDGAVNIDNQVDKASLELFVNINREKAGILGVPIFEIDRTIRATVAGMPVSTFRGEEEKDYPMVLYLSHDNKISIEDFSRIYVKSLSGAMVPVSQLASLELIQGPGVITHYNMERSATITADIIKGYSLDEVVASIEEEFRNYQFPDGYTYKYTGELESREESFGGIIKASIIALLAIIAILVLQFRSFSQPFIIFSALPLAVIGSTLALYITGNSFSFTAGIGFISLIGIVVNNAIILVDYTNKLQTGGKDLVASLVEAGETRFRPIILTTLTTIGGLLPLTLRGGTLWAPLGWTIIGGLLVSTILTLLVVPVLYKVFSPNPK
jgi:multidrug efflux pump subunit AcrB